MNNVEIPGGMPIVGHLIPFLRDGLKFVTDMHDRTGVLRFRIGPMKLNAITDPHLLREVLSDSRFTRGRFFKIVKKFAGEGSIVSTSGDVHTHDRKTLRKSFSKARLHATVTDLQETTCELTEEWRPGTTADVAQWSNVLMFSMFVRSLMAGVFSRKECHTVATAVPILTGELVKRTLLPDWYDALPTPDNRRFRRVMSSVDDSINRAVAAYGSTKHKKDDLLGTLAEGRAADGKPYTDRKIRDHIFGFVLASVEAPTVALSWSLYHLALQPRVEAAFHHEVDTVLGGQPVTAETVHALPLTQRIILESARMYPNWFLTRETSCPLDIDGTHLPAHAQIIYSPYGMHRHSRWFPEPQAWIPDRWLPQNEQARDEIAFIPFGAGFNHCIGEYFAMLELTTALATIGQKWRF